MWKTWISGAWRNYLRYKSFSLLNISGLTLGIVSLIAILLYVIDEFEFDKHNKNASRIFRVNTITDFGTQKSTYATSSTPLAEAIRSDIPEVESAARLFQRQATIQLMGERASEQKYLEDNFYFADPDIFKVLTFNFIVGNDVAPMENINQILISRKIAVKYFGDVDDAIGKPIQFEGTIPLEVAGVFEDLPNQSSLPIELIAHFENYFTIEPEFVREFLRTDWLYGPVTTLVLLREGIDKINAQKKIQELNGRYADERVQKSVTYELQQLLKIHLYSSISYTADQNGIQRVYIFLSVGVLILLIACINFINLSTVHALKRAKEIGVRKVMGANKSNISNQFLLESSILVLLSVVLAIIIVSLILPQINLLSGKSFTADSLLNKKVGALLISIFLFTSLAAGLYPSFHIARFSPINALKGLKGTSIRNGLLLRRTLVVIQFASSIILIISTVVIYMQMEYVQKRPLGFQKDFILTIPLFSDNMNSILGGGVGGELRGRMNGFENEVMKIPAVEATTVSSVLPGQSAVSALIKTDKILETDNVFIPVVSVDYDFLDTYKMTLLKGRNFDKQTGTDHLEALIANEEAVKLLGFQLPEEAVGQLIEVLGKKATIIGIVKNFNFEGLQQSIRPLLMEVSVSKFLYFSMRLNNQNIPASIKLVKTQWDTFFPEKVFAYKFLDTELHQSYEAEHRFGNLIKSLSILAILISGLGLFGLAAYIGHQKQKEAGVRKILGANTAHVYYTFSKEYILVLLIATLIAAPIGYYLSEKWLSNFAFHISFDWVPLIISFLCTAIVVLFTTSFQTYKAANTNPVDALRIE